MRLLVFAFCSLLVACASETSNTTSPLDSVDELSETTDTLTLVDTFTLRKPPAGSVVGTSEHDSILADAASLMQGNDDDGTGKPAIEADILELSPDAAPQFQGGEAGMNQWLSRHLIYPATAWQNNIRGVVIVRFAIEKDGRVSDAIVTRKLSPDCDEAALRAVERMPAWIPARKAGKPVKTIVSIPVNFDAQQ